MVNGNGNYLGVGSGSLGKWELQFRDSLATVLENAICFQHVEDKWIWLEDGSGEYTTSSANKALNVQRWASQMDDVMVIIWKMKIPSKAIMLVWRAFLGANHGSFVERNMVLQPEEILCPFWSCNESIQHVLFTYDKVYKVWLRCYQWLNISIVLHESPINNFWNHLGVQ